MFALVSSLLWVSTSVHLLLALTEEHAHMDSVIALLVLLEFTVKQVTVLYWIVFFITFFVTESPTEGPTAPEATTFTEESTTQGTFFVSPRFFTLLI